MSGIFGLVHLDGAPVRAADLAPMRSAMVAWGPDGVRTAIRGCVALGQCVLFNTPEAVHESLPIVSGDERFAFTAEGRIDNREDLLTLCEVPRAEWPAVSDGELMRRAYERWGEAAPSKLLGDWSFAAFDFGTRRLFLARDQHGRTAIYYASDGRFFAFASDRRALLALPEVPRRLNEPYLAKAIVGWFGYGGTETIYKDIHRVPPAHWLRVSEAGAARQQYWDLGTIEPVRLRSDDAYVDAFLDVFRRAVRCRLRSYRPIALTLSGGLDSTAIAVIAARELGASARELTALTSVPLVDSHQAVGPDQVPDEWTLAHSVAERAGIRHVRIATPRPTPIEGIRRSLEWYSEPVLIAVHAYWVEAVLEEARRLGCGTMLDGDTGNFTISWGGIGRSRARELLVASLPPAVRRRVGVWRNQRILRHGDEPWRVLSAIRPSFAERIDLVSLMKTTGFVPGAGIIWREGENARAELLQVGRTFAGACSAERHAAMHLESRGPAEDARVISFVFAIPESQFIGPPSRWLLRRAMAAYLPDGVRLNVRRGAQGADVIHRLRLAEHETTHALAELESSPIVHEYLDLQRMRDVARDIVTRRDPVTTRRARTVLLRGIAVGLFLTQFDGGGFQPH